jgi:hypothetical protein
MSKLQVHTIDQPDTDITAFVLSCNRLQLLEGTMKSFLETRDLITKIVIVDDSGVPGVFDILVEKYGKIADVVCFPENRGLYWAKDFMTSFCHTDYIFYVEDDWLFLKSGYLSKSKELLKKYRNLGSIDISWRTFEEEGLDTYEDELIDNCFYWKKPWRISKNHLHWFVWQGSPNLKRREDLILLGRVEKYFTEWNIDRKFHSLGFKGAYLNDRYVIHTGDNYSVMAAQRKNENATPETLFPTELIGNRTYPSFDYYGLDKIVLKDKDCNFVSHKKRKRVIVTALVDIGREGYDGRNFDSHYVKGLDKILETTDAIIIYCDESLFERIYRIRGSRPTLLIPFNEKSLENYRYYKQIKTICSNTEWINQSDWMKNSIIRNPYYVTTTHYKMDMLTLCAQSRYFLADEYYWVDSGLFNSYSIPNDMSHFDLSKIPSDNFFMTSFPYDINRSGEIHGYSIEGYSKMCNSLPNKVMRASLFGGNVDSIRNMYNIFESYVKISCENGFMGTEESIFTAIYLNKPNLFNEFPMVSGDINQFMNTIRI